MMLNKLKLLLLASFTLCIVSCEYDLKEENNRVIHLPSEFHQFDLNLVPELDTIWVVSSTEFTYNFNTFGLEIKDFTFTLNGKKLNVSDKNSFFISPYYYSKGYYELSLVLYTSSGSGSISDIMGAEGYKAEKKWILYIDKNPNIITLSYSITKEGFLKITWPKLPLVNFSFYDFGGSINSVLNSIYISKTINNIDSTSYIDSTYVGGEASFGIIYVFKPDEWENLHGYLLINEPIPTLQFEDKGVDSLRIFWNKSRFKSRYNLIRTNIYPDLTILESAIDTSCTIAQPGFGAGALYILYTSPFHIITPDNRYSIKNSQSHTLGNYIAGNHPDFGYNHLDKALYTNTYDDMECYDITSMNKLISTRIQDFIYQSLYSCPTNSTKVATISANNIYVFADKTLQNPIIIPYYCLGKSIDHFLLTDNDLIAITSYNKYELISVANKTVIATIDISDYPVYSKWACSSTSKDAKFACFVTGNGINLYSIEDTANINIIYSDNRSYRSVLFNINNANQLFLTFNGNNNLEIRNASDFSLVKTISLPTNAEVLRNIDPANGYLLLTDYINLYVLDLETSEIVFKIKCSTTDYRSQLYGNRLFSDSGYTLDISKYLAK